MNIFVFGSRTMTNIWAGVGARRWAISEDQANMPETAAKASKVPIGSFGILYCSEKKIMTTPFVVTSRPDPDGVVDHVWDGVWRFPFEIAPLGTPNRAVSTELLADLPSAQATGQRWNNVLPVQGQFVFQPSTITDVDWEYLYSRLHHQ